MTVHAGVDKNSGLIHSLVVRAANGYDLISDAELLHGDEKVVYGDDGYQGIAMRPEMAGKTTQFWLATWPRKRRAPSDMAEDRLYDRIETANAHIGSKLCLHSG